MNERPIEIAGMRVPVLLKRGQVLRLMGLLGAGGRHTFDKWTDGSEPVLPDARPEGSLIARYRRSDVLRAIQPGTGRPS